MLSRYQKPKIAGSAYQSVAGTRYHAAAAGTVGTGLRVSEARGVRNRDDPKGAGKAGINRAGNLYPVAYRITMRDPGFPSDYIVVAHQSAVGRRFQKSLRGFASRGQVAPHQNFALRKKIVVQDDGGRR